CGGSISEGEYHAQLFFVGPSGYTIAVHLNSSDESGILHGQTLVGRIGYRGDIILQKELLRGGNRYVIVADGLASAEVLLFTVQVWREGEGERCLVEAEYSGFS